MEDLFGVYGRLHMVVLHMPLGIILALAALELVAARRKEALPRSFAGWLVALGAASAVLAATSGWTLGGEDDYGASDTLFNHRWLGVALASCTVLFALAYGLGALRLYRTLLVVSTVLLFPVGHLGGTMTHGKGFLTESLREERSREPRVEEPPEVGDTTTPAIEPGDEEPTPPDDPDPVAPIADSGAGAGATYASVIAPILEDRCVACHGPEKQKGKLALHTIEGLQAGGSFGSLLAAELPNQPELLYRIDLPVEDPDHMPPEGKPQLSADQLAALRTWVQAGAPFEDPFELDVSILPEPEPLPVPEPDPNPDPVPAPDPQALAALTAELVHVESLDPSTHRLWIDFTAIATNTDDARATRLLEPLVDHVVHLNLARTRTAGDTLALCARMPRLARLDLRATGLDDASLARLAGHPALTELVLARTSLTDAAVDTLLDLPALERVWLWDSGLSADAIARLAEERPALAIDDGTRPDAATLEEEPEVVFTKPESSEVETGAEVATGSAAPINTTCPVSGSPIDPRYGAIYEGVVIGFCCPNCPKQFWEDPAGFLAKIE